MTIPQWLNRLRKNSLDEGGGLKSLRENHRSELSPLEPALSLSNGDA
jgi:hypothetical protein